MIYKVVHCKYYNPVGIIISNCAYGTEEKLIEAFKFNWGHPPIELEKDEKKKLMF